MPNIKQFLEIQMIHSRCDLELFKLDLQNGSHHQASILESQLQLHEELFFG